MGWLVQIALSSVSIVRPRLGRVGYGWDQEALMQCVRGIFWLRGAGFEPLTFRKSLRNKHRLVQCV